jgi:hypothetical protein
MTASETAKESGLKSLADVSKLTGVSTQTLNNWHNDKTKLFAIVIAGCVHSKDDQKERKAITGDEDVSSNN